MDPVTLARLSAGPPPSPVLSPEPDASVTVLTTATAGLSVCAGTSPPARCGGSRSPPPRPPPTGSLPIPGAALRGAGKENGAAAGASPPPRAGSSAPYGMSPPAALLRSPVVGSSPAPVAPYQALPVHGPVTITHHLTAGLPVVEPGEMSKEVRRHRGGERERGRGGEREASGAASQLPPAPDAGRARLHAGSAPPVRPPQVGVWSGRAPIRGMREGDGDGQGGWVGRRAPV